MGIFRLREKPDAPAPSGLYAARLFGSIPSGLPLRATAPGRLAALMWGHAAHIPPPLGLPPERQPRRADGPTWGEPGHAAPKPVRWRTGWPVGAGAVALQLALRAAPRSPAKGMPWRSYAPVNTLSRTRNSILAVLEVVDLASRGR